jgi:fucose 4-O-acetylase-like acetyltransferase
MSAVDRPRGLLAMAAATPPDRDRYVDFLRGFSILVVVFGHWLIAAVTWQNGTIQGRNALEVIRGTWALTWVLQVMPLFFFVGGFSNLRTWRAARRDGVGYAGFTHSRMIRMLRPTIVFLGIGSVVTVTLDALNVADNVVFPASTLITRPLWFLGVYMIVVALAPAMADLHERYGVAVLLAMTTIAVAVDILRFGAGLSAVGYVNYPVVWLTAHQLGFFYADGRLSTRVGWMMAPFGLVALLGMMAFGPYHGSMVGLATDEFSNMDPPTLMILALILWEVGLVLVLRGPVSRWLGRVRVWAGVIFVNSVIMTVFLWHLTAMLLGIGILYPLGWPQPDPGTTQWWLLRPVWIVALLVVLAGFVALFGRFEQRGFGQKAPAGATGFGAALATVLASFLLVLGVLGFAIGGMHQLFGTGTALIVFTLNPAANLLHLVLGGLALRASVRSGVAATTVLAVVGAGLGFLALAGPLHGFVADHLALDGAGSIAHGVAAVLAFVAAGTARRTAPLG